MKDIIRIFFLGAFLIYIICVSRNVLGEAAYIIEFILCIIWLPSLAIWIGNKMGRIVRKIKNFNMDDFKRSKYYYREILEINSPLIIGYIDNFEIDKNKIIAELMYLKKKNLLQIKDGKLLKNNEFNESNLKECEKKLIENIQNNEISNIILREFVQCEAENMQLVNSKKTKNNKTKNKINKGLVNKVSVAIILITGLLGFFDYKIFVLGSILVAIIYMVIIIMSLISFFGYLPFMNSYKTSKGIICKRTSKGRELNQKLEGLKNYLKDYSLMDEREAKEIELWDDYLIYSVMFGHNKKIIEEYEKYIEIIE